MKKDLTIIGAGLSGLYAAFLLQDKYNIKIVEAKEKTGGRIVSNNGFDLGPSWVWEHHNNILELIKNLNLKIFSQYTKGYSIYDDKIEVKRFNAPQNAQAYRIEGGMYKIIETLEKNKNAKIYTNEQVLKITEIDDKILIKTNIQEFKSDYVIFAIPPRIVVQDIFFTPRIDELIVNKMKNIATWMAHSSKCIIEYKKAFWKNEDLSGFAYSHYGPLVEVHDASQENKAALFGFFNTKSTINKDEVINQLVRLFGEKAADYISFDFIDWKKDKYISTKEDSNINYNLFEYGLDISLYNKKIQFIGTEYSYEQGGYLEGAIIKAKEICKDFI